MNIVYNDKNIVIATFSSNSDASAMSPFTFKKMFPSHNNLRHCKIDVPHSTSVIGAEVESRCGIVCSLRKGGDVLFDLPKEDFEKMLFKNNQEVNKKREQNFPCVSNKFDSSSFMDRISRFPQTSSLIQSQISNGSYFDNKIVKTGWWGCFTDAGGYANMNREITKRLHNHYIIPYVRVYNTIHQIEPQAVEVINMYSSLSPKKGDHPFVYSYTPMPHEYHTGKRIFFTMMETASLHPTFMNHCNKYSDEVWVPSQSNKDIFSSCGVKKPIKVVPLGIDELIYFNNKSPVKSSLPFTGIYGKSPLDGIGSFKFLTVIQWNFRKGFDILLKSFVNAFGSQDDVCLVISTQYPLDVVKRDLDQFLPRNHDLPQVLLHNQITPTVDMPSFYKYFDCYVHLSRGEGFSLTQIEAAACGLPVISCYHSGMTEYLTEENSFRVICNETERCDPRLAAICLFYQNQLLWKLGDSQVEQTVEHMRNVISNKDLASKKAGIFLQDVKNKFTWEKTTGRVASYLKA